MQHGKLRALGTPAELTRQYIKRQTVEIEVGEGQSEKAIQSLMEKSSLIASEPIFEKGLLRVTASGRESIPEILALLTRQEISVYRLTPQDVDLEEVYFALNGDVQ